MKTRKQVIATAMTGIAAATLLTTIGAAPAQAASYTYISVLTPSGYSGTKVLDITDYSTADRGRAQLWALRTTGEIRNQRWSIEQVGTLNGHGVYRLVNQLSSKCLDKSQDTADANGNAVYQYSCSGTSNQQWEFIPGTDSYSRWGQLKNVSDGRCLDINGPSFSDGAVLHIWSCYATWSQRWNIDY